MGQSSQVNTLKNQKCVYEKYELFPKGIIKGKKGLLKINKQI